MKILVASTISDSLCADAYAVSASVLSACSAATVEIILKDNFSDVLSHAASSSINGIARNVNDFDTGYLLASSAALSGIWISWGHGSNSFTEINTPDNLVTNAIGVGWGINNSNSGSYGPALDFFVNIVPNESQACGYIAGKIGQILIDNPTYTFENARYLLRKNSSYFPNYHLTGGYGYVVTGSISSELIKYWKPNQPLSFSGNRINTTVNLSWSAQSDATQYNIFRKTNASDVFSSLTSISNASITSFVDNTIFNNLSYFYSMNSYNSVSQQTSISSNPLLSFVIFDKLKYQLLFS